MICDKCGKSNIRELKECIYCGAEMPKTSGSGGFADILSYKAEGDFTPSPVKPETSKDETNIQKLIKKYDKIMKSAKRNSLLAIGLSGLMLISSIVFGVLAICSVKNYIAELKKELSEYKSQINIILEEDRQKNKIDEENNLINKKMEVEKNDR